MKQMMSGWLLLATAAFAQQGVETARPKLDNVQPTPIQSVGFDQKLNAQLPLDLPFRDEAGRSVTLRDYFKRKPVMLALVYYECPMLCTVVLNGITRSLKMVPFTPGRDFEIVLVSINPRETPALARTKKDTYLGEYGRPGNEAGWHFLTGEESSIKPLADAVGFRYAWDEELQQYAHAAGMMVATPEGRLARYYYGVEFIPQHVKFGLMEAAQNRIGSPVDKVLLYCYHYDATTGKYTPWVMASIRTAGFATVFGLIALIGLLQFRREHFRPRHSR
ncbi:MAG TPA: SCO family protein [Bryobacteraceae bacterium]|nr:SCO family protein [Bryobacteraceae bacterium]